MTSPIVRTTSPPGQALKRRPSPPEVPGEYGLSTEFRCMYQGKSVGFEVYGRRSYGDAYVRLIDDAGSMDAGTVIRGGTTRAIVRWTREAFENYDRDWLTEQADDITKRLSERWRAS